MRDQWQIIREALRRFRGKPWYTSVIILCLALGIGANTAVFSVVKTLLLNPLMVKDIDRLFFPMDVHNGNDYFSDAAEDYVAISKRAKSFSSIGIAQPTSLKLIGTEKPEQLHAALISATYFTTLGINPIVGRTFKSEDDRPGADPVAIVSYELWQRDFGGDPKLVGRKLTLSNRIYSVIGVMPANFDLPEGAEVWVPLATDLETLPQPERLKHAYITVVRLKPDVSVKQAEAEVHIIGLQLEQDFHDWRGGWGIKLVSLRQEILGDITGSVRPVISLLMFVVSFLLLIACVNVANLLLVRALERNHEISVQIALGASTKRMVSQLLAESLMLSLAGGFIGLGLAKIATRLFSSFKVATGMDMKGLLGHIDLDVTVLLFTFGISLVTGLLFGLAPILQVLSPGTLIQNLREGSRESSIGVAGKRWLNMLMTVEITMAMILLIGAGLMIRNFQQLNNAKLGFRKDHLLSIPMYLSPEDYATHQKRADFVKRLVERVRTIPGVISAGATTNIPLDQPSKDTAYVVEGKPPSDSSEVPQSSDRVVTPGYLEMMNIALLRGRFLSDQDRPDTLPVIVVSRELARRSWGDEDPIGKRIKIGYPPDPNSPWYTVVGMVDNVKEDRWNYEVDREVWYMSYAQRDLNLLPVRLVVLTKGDPISLAADVRNAIWSINKNQTVGEAVSIEAFFEDYLGPQHLTAVLGTIFAGIGLVLAVVGIYSVTSYSVTRRTREFGIRVALGAQRKDVVRMVLKDGLRLAFLGLAAGLVFGFILSRLISSILFQVGPVTPQMLAGGVVCLIMVATAAMYIPARRAMLVDPNETLRYE